MRDNIYTGLYTSYTVVKCLCEVRILPDNNVS